MQIRASKLLCGGLAAAALCIGGAAHATAVTNGGFETGDFTGWTQFGDGSFTNVDTLTPHSGSYAAYFGPSTPGGISQTLDTVAGQSYHVFFWLQNEADVNGVSIPNSFEFDWGGTAEMTLNNAPAFGYTRFDFDLVATAASTALAFTFTQQPQFWDLDDVTVPEPGSLALVGLGGMLAALAARRRAAPAPVAA